MKNINFDEPVQSDMTETFKLPLNTIFFYHNNVYYIFFLS